MSFSLLIFAYAAVVVFAAGIVRGATGFGFSMLALVMLTFVLPPAQVVPLLLIWEMFASAGHAPFVWRQCNWRICALLLAGIIPLTPLGMMLLLHLPTRTMTVGVNGIVLALTLLLISGLRPRRTLGPLGIMGVGALAGFINGASSNGGPPVVLFMMMSLPAEAARATLIVLFLAFDIQTSCFFVYSGLMTWQSALDALVVLPFMWLDMWLGTRWFHRVDEALFRRCVMFFLMVVSVVGMIRALI